MTDIIARLKDMAGYLEGDITITPDTHIVMIDAADAIAALRAELAAAKADLMVAQDARHRLGHDLAAAKALLRDGLVWIDYGNAPRDLVDRVTAAIGEGK